MTDLRSCYFCGTAEAVEEGPAVPPALEPPEAVQQSVVLCPACREKLTAVLEPVFDHGAGGSESADDGSPASESDHDAGDGSLFGVFDADTPESPVGSDSGSDGPSASGTGDAGASEDAPADGPPVDRIPDPGARASADTDSTDGPADSDSGDAPADADGGDAEADTPEGYYTVLRFLENREFPVARAEIERVVAGAYDLSEREVADIVDAAVDRGVLVEVGGTLARSREQL